MIPRRSKTSEEMLKVNRESHLLWLVFYYWRKDQSRSRDTPKPRPNALAPTKIFILGIVKECHCYLSHETHAMLSVLTHQKCSSMAALRRPHYHWRHAWAMRLITARAVTQLRAIEIWDATVRVIAARKLSDYKSRIAFGCWFWRARPRESERYCFSERRRWMLIDTVISHFCFTQGFLSQVLDVSAARISILLWRGSLSFLCWYRCVLGKDKVWNIHI